MAIPPKLLEFIESHRTSHSAVNDADEDLHLDSLGFMRLVTYLETDFGIRVEDEELDIQNFETLRKLEAYLDSKSDAVNCRERLEKNIID